MATVRVHTTRLANSSDHTCRQCSRVDLFWLEVVLPRQELAEFQDPKRELTVAPLAVPLAHFYKIEVPFKLLRSSQSHIVFYILARFTKPANTCVCYFDLLPSGGLKCRGLGELGQGFVGLRLGLKKRPLLIHQCFLFPYHIKVLVTSEDGHNDRLVADRKCCTYHSLPR